VRECFSYVICLLVSVVFKVTAFTETILCNFSNGSLGKDIPLFIGM
jgi:hypothetical protein